MGYANSRAFITAEEKGGSYRVAARPSKCLEQFGHRWPEVVAHAHADAGGSFGACLQHCSCLILAAQFDQHLSEDKLVVHSA